MADILNTETAWRLGAMLKEQLGETLRIWCGTSDWGSNWHLDTLDRAAPHVAAGCEKTGCADSPAESWTASFADCLSGVLRDADVRRQGEAPKRLCDSDREFWCAHPGRLCPQRTRSVTRQGERTHLAGRARDGIRRKSKQACLLLNLLLENGIDGPWITATLCGIAMRGHKKLPLCEALLRPLWTTSKPCPVCLIAPSMCVMHIPTWLFNAEIHADPHGRGQLRSRLSGQCGGHRPGRKTT